jgi:hypothetical protein
MLILTPSEVATFREAYLHSLAVALVNRDTKRWNGATAEEQQEVRARLGRHISFPTDKQMKNATIRDRTIAAAAREKAAAALAKVAKRSTARAAKSQQDKPSA